MPGIKIVLLKRLKLMIVIKANATCNPRLKKFLFSVNEVNKSSFDLKIWWYKSYIWYDIGSKLSKQKSYLCNAWIYVILIWSILVNELWNYLFHNEIFIIFRVGKYCFVSCLLELWHYDEKIVRSLTQQDILKAVNETVKRYWFWYSYALLFK